MCNVRGDKLVADEGVRGELAVDLIVQTEDDLQIKDCHLDVGRDGTVNLHQSPRFLVVRILRRIKHLVRIVHNLGANCSLFTNERRPCGGENCRQWTSTVLHLIEKFLQLPTGKVRLLKSPFGFNLSDNAVSTSVDRLTAEKLTNGFLCQLFRLRSVWIVENRVGGKESQTGHLKDDRVKEKVVSRRPVEWVLAEAPLNKVSLKWVLKGLNRPLDDLFSDVMVDVIVVRSRNFQCGHLKSTHAKGVNVHGWGKGRRSRRTAIFGRTRHYLVEGQFGCDKMKVGASRICPDRFDVSVNGVRSDGANLDEPIVADEYGITIYVAVNDRRLRRM